MLISKSMNWHELNPFAIHNPSNCEYISESDEWIVESHVREYVLGWVNDHLNGIGTHVQHLMLSNSILEMMQYVKYCRLPMKSRCHRPKKSYSMGKGDAGHSTKHYKRTKNGFRTTEDNPAQWLCTTKCWTILLHARKYRNLRRKFIALTDTN